MLTERKKADREIMAQRIEALCKKHGATCERDEIMTRERCIHLNIETQRGLSCSVDFDGDSCQHDVHVVSWYIRGMDRTPRLVDHFSNSGINPYHRMKATDIAHGFDELIEVMDHSLGMAMDGSAFMREAA